jgi:hypothetical protein
MGITLPADLAARLGEPVEPPPEDTSAEETPADLAPADPAPAPTTPAQTTPISSGVGGGEVSENVLDAAARQLTPGTIYGSGVTLETVDEPPESLRSPVNPIADNLELLRSMNIDTSLPSPPMNRLAEIQHPTHWREFGSRRPGRRAAGTNLEIDPQLSGGVDYRNEAFTPMRKSLAAQQAEMRQLNQVGSALRERVTSPRFSPQGQPLVPQDQVEQAQMLLQQIDARRRQLAPELRTEVNNFRYMAETVMEIRDLYPRSATEAMAAMPPKRKEELQRRGLQNILREDYGVENAATMQEAIARYVETRPTAASATPAAAAAPASGASGVPSEIPMGLPEYGVDRSSEGEYEGAKWYGTSRDKLYYRLSDGRTGGPISLSEEDVNNNIMMTPEAARQ